MLFDQRVRERLRDAGVDADTLRRIEDEVAAEARETADRIETFFDRRDVVYSTMDRTHSSSDLPEHAVEYADLFTHSQDIRGFVRFDTWGAYVEGGRVLEEGDEHSEQADVPALVELTLGPTVHDRVLFAPDRESLR